MENDEARYDKEEIDPDLSNARLTVGMVENYRSGGEPPDHIDRFQPPHVSVRNDEWFPNNCWRVLLMPRNGGRE